MDCAIIYIGAALFSFANWVRILMVVKLTTNASNYKFFLGNFVFPHAEIFFYSLKQAQHYSLKWKFQFQRKFFFSKKVAPLLHLPTLTFGGLLHSIQQTKSTNFDVCLQKKGRDKKYLLLRRDASQSVTHDFPLVYVPLHPWIKKESITPFYRMKIE